MDFVKVSPSPTFLTVLEELHSCPGAPKSIQKYFAHKKRISNDTASGDETQTPGDGTEPTSDNTKLTSDDAVPANSDETPPLELLLLTSDVKWCHEKMRERGIPHRIHQLLNQSRIILPTYEAPARNPQLEARIARLRTDQANREYNDMTKNVSLRTSYAASRGASLSGIGREVREMHSEVNRQLVHGLQYLVSIVGTFFALFIGLGFAEHAYAPRLVIAIAGALAVGLAELYFIIREDLRAEDLKKKN